MDIRALTLRINHRQLRLVRVLRRKELSVDFWVGDDHANYVNSANVNARVLLRACGREDEYLDGEASGESLRRMLQCLMISMNTAEGARIIEASNDGGTIGVLPGGAKVVIWGTPDDYLDRQGARLLELIKHALDEGKPLRWG